MTEAGPEPAVPGETRGTVRARDDGDFEQPARKWQGYEVEQAPASSAAGRAELLPQKRTGEQKAPPESKQARHVGGLPVCVVADLPAFSDAEATIAYLSHELGEEEENHLIVGSFSREKREQQGRSSSSTSSPAKVPANVQDFDIDVGTCENVRCADTGTLLDPKAVREGRLRE